jgi:hypothetical protein
MIPCYNVTCYIISPSVNVFRETVFQLWNLQRVTFRKLLPCHPKLFKNTGSVARYSKEVYLGTALHLT